MTARADKPEASGGEASVDLPQKLRDEIRDFARALPDMSCYEMLGVGRHADAAEIQEGFFERSKVFHPDRYFNKQVGVYADLLHEIYKQIVVAHDMLGDAKTKAAYDKTLPPVDPASAPPPASKPMPASRPAPAAQPEPAAPDAMPTPPTRPSTPRKAGSSLRERRAFEKRTAPLSGLKHRLASGKKKAQRLCEDAREQRDKGEFPRAASLARLAVAYDPRCRAYTDLLGEILPEANAARVTEARQRGRKLLERGQFQEAIEALTAASHLAPTDVGLAAQLAELYARSGSMKSAIDFARHAVELEENDIGYRKLLARLYRQNGQDDAARKQLQRAWEMDPMDEEVKVALTEV